MFNSIIKIIGVVIAIQAFIIATLAASVIIVWLFRMLIQVAYM